jgi:AraC-like DNA-binding protein
LWPIRNIKHYRIACPWLIKRFIDPDARIFFAPFDQVRSKAIALDATPFDIPDTEFTHYEDRCTFDFFLEKYEIEEPALRDMAVIIRGADTDNHTLASQSSGLWAISAGMAYNISDDQELLAKGMLLYDSLYSWAKHLQKEKHTQSPTEKLLLAVFNTYLDKQNLEPVKTPKWAKELKEIIQDQIDTNLSLSLKEIAEGLQIHPSYVSREFSKYFSNLSFGEYIRKLRIEKAIDLLRNPAHTLSEVAYLTGFSDQSHFNRIFKAHTGLNPSQYRKGLSGK